MPPLEREFAETTFLRTEHIAERLGVSTGVVGTWIQRHQLRGFRMPGRCIWQVSAAEVIEFMDRTWPELDFGAPEPLWHGERWSALPVPMRVAMMTKLYSPEDARQSFEVTCSTTTDLWQFVKTGHIRARKAMLRRRRYMIVAADLVHFADHQLVALAS